MGKITIQNAKERYVEENVKQKLVDLYTGRKFFILGLIMNDRKDKPQALHISESIALQLLDLQTQYSDRPFYLSFICLKPTSLTQGVPVTIKENLILSKLRQWDKKDTYLFTVKVVDNLKAMRLLGQMRRK